MSNNFFKNKYYNYLPFASKILEKRIKNIVDQIDEFIKTEDKVLDIGSGGGWIAKEIKDRKNGEVVLLDVFDFNQTDLKIIIYDGKKIPFPDNSFDVVTVIFVLHHIENQKEVLKEIKRVAKNKIIIIEDTYNSYFGKMILCIWDVFSNLPSFLVKPFAEKFPFKFLKVSEWEDIFIELNLKLIFKKETYSRGGKKALFVLKK